MTMFEFYFIFGVHSITDFYCGSVLEKATLMNAQRALHKRKPSPPSWDFE